MALDQLNNLKLNHKKSERMALPTVKKTETTPNHTKITIVLQNEWILWETMDSNLLCTA